MNKVVHVGSYKADGWCIGKAVYCRICTEEKECTLLDGSTDTVTVLSITGVVGPRSNGYAYEAGQCADTVRRCTPGAGWTADMVQRLCDIWSKYHRNDLCLYCEHQRDWDGSKLLTVYEYKMNSETLAEQRRLKDYVKHQLSVGAVVQLQEPKLSLYNAPYTIKSWSNIEPHGYTIDKIKEKPARSVYPLDAVTKYSDKHPDGILAKPCPVCGYKWGTQWRAERAERVPQDVLDWLAALPDTDRKPAWC